MEKENLNKFVAVGGRGNFPHVPSVEEIKKKVELWNPQPSETKEDIESTELDEAKTLDEIIEEVAREEGLTVEEVKEHLHKFQRDLYKKYTKKKVDKTKARAKKKQAKKSKKRNR